MYNKFTIRIYVNSPRKAFKADFTASQGGLIEEIKLDGSWNSQKGGWTA
jgi:hypothetical protein